MGDAESDMYRSEATQVRHSSQVDDVLSSLEKELAAQDEILVSLFARLESVCIPPPPTPGEVDRSTLDEDRLVPLAERIKFILERTRTHNHRLVELVQRIEV